MYWVQRRFSDLFPADRIKRKRVLQTIFNKLRSETFRERKAILKRLYRVGCLKENWTGRILFVGPDIYDETTGQWRADAGRPIDDSEDIVRGLLRAQLLPGFYYVESVYEKIERILLVGPDTEDDPEDIVHASRLEYLLPVIRLANIPAEIGKFLRYVIVQHTTTVNANQAVVADSVLTGRKNQAAPSAKLLAAVTDKPMEIIEAVEKQKETMPMVGGGTKPK